MTVLMPTARDEDTWSQAVWPLGAHIGADGVTFAVYAPAATRLELELYPAATGADAHWTTVLAKGPDGIWRGHVGNVGPGGYTWRAHRQRGAALARLIEALQDVGGTRPARR